MLVIGNGESRKDLNIDAYERTKIGCNAVFRDSYVHHLICCDRRMVIEAQESKYKGTLYTRRDWVDQFKNVEVVPELPYKGDTRPDDPWHWGSGPFAVLLASRLCYEFKQPVHLIGFDLESDTNTVNNLYKGTKNYAKEDSRPIDPSYWIYQMNKVFEHSKDIQFIYYNTKPWPKIINNVTSKGIEEYNAIRS